MADTWEEEVGGETAGETWEDRVNAEGPAEDSSAAQADEEEAE